MKKMSAEKIYAASEEWVKANLYNHKAKKWLKATKAQKKTEKTTEQGMHRITDPIT